MLESDLSDFHKKSTVEFCQVSYYRMKLREKKRDFEVLCSEQNKGVKQKKRVRSQIDVAGCFLKAILLV